MLLPRRGPVVEAFATQLANDAKRLLEDEETGAQSYRYVKLGTNHYSLAWTYWLAIDRLVVWPTLDRRFIRRRPRPRLPR